MQYFSNDVFLENSKQYINEEFLLEVFLYLEKTFDIESKYFFNELLGSKKFSIFSGIFVLTELKNQFLDDNNFDKTKCFLKNNGINKKFSELIKLFHLKLIELEDKIDIYYRIEFDEFLKIKNNEFILNNTKNAYDILTFSKTKLLLEENHKKAIDLENNELYFLGKINYNDIAFLQLNKNNDEFELINFYEKKIYGTFYAEITSEKDIGSKICFKLLPYIKHPKHNDCLIFFNDDEMEQRINFIKKTLKNKFLENEKKSF